MHVYVVDKAGNKVPGVEATYGFAFKIHYDNTDFTKSTVEWKVWGQKLGVDVVDSNQPVTEDPVQFLQKAW